MITDSRYPGRGGRKKKSFGNSFFRVLWNDNFVEIKNPVAKSSVKTFLFIFLQYWSNAFRKSMIGREGARTVLYDDDTWYGVLEYSARMVYRSTFLGCDPAILRANSPSKFYVLYASDRGGNAGGRPGGHSVCLKNSAVQLAVVQVLLYILWVISWVA